VWVTNSPARSIRAPAPVLQSRSADAVVLARAQAQPPLLLAAGCPDVPAAPVAPPVPLVPVPAAPDDKKTAEVSLGGFE